MNEWLSKRWGRVLLLGALALTTIVFLYSTRAVLPPFLLAFVIAYVLSPPVDYLTRWRFRRPFAILTVYALLIMAVAVIIFFLVPSLISELNRLARALPTYTEQVRDWAEAIQALPRRAPLPESLQVAYTETIQELEDTLLQITEGAAKSLLGALSGAFSLILSPFLAYYLILDEERLKQAAISVIPAGLRGQILELVGEVNGVLGGFLRGQALLAGIIFLAVAAGLMFLQMRFVLVLSLLAGIGEFIPYFGPLLSAIPAVAIAFVQSPWLALKVVILFVVVQQLEGAVLAPRILGARVGLHPLAVIFALLAGGYLLGFWGLVFAVPIAGTLRVVLAFLLERLTSPPD